MTGSVLPWIFFALFALILLGGYVAIRRRMAPTYALAILVIAGSILAMFLSGLTAGDSPPHAAFVGLLVGGLFSVIVLVVALYFQRAERRHKAPPADAPASPNETAE